MTVQINNSIISGPHTQTNTETIGLFKRTTSDLPESVYTAGLRGDRGNDGQD